MSTDRYSLVPVAAVSGAMNGSSNNLRQRDTQFVHATARDTLLLLLLLLLCCSTSGASAAGGGSAAGGDTSSRDKEILALAMGIEAGLCQPDEGFMEEDATKLKFPILYEESMNTVLRQEQQKFNRLLRVMKKTLHGVQLAVQGLAVMSTALEDMADAFYTQRVPAAWEAVGYPSLKPLGAWVSELTQRCDFMVDWVDNGTPLKFWVSGFFFPQAFLTGNLQNYGTSKLFWWLLSILSFCFLFLFAAFCYDGVSSF